MSAKPLSHARQSVAQRRSIAHLFLDLLDLLAVLVEDVLADEVGTLELLARQRAQPLVLPELLEVRKIQ